MNDFNGILLCTDLDGTLLKSDKSISERNLRAIEFFKENGGIFTFITGRMPKSVQNIWETVKPNAPIGCINGGGIYDCKTQEYLWMTPVCEKVLELVSYIDKALPDMGFQVNTAKEVYFCKDNPAMVRFRQLTNLPYITCDYNAIKEPIAKVLFSHLDGRKMEELIELLKSHPLSEEFTLIRSEEFLYEILPKNISKATALTKMTELLNLDINKTIAVGDYDNDILMIKTAKTGIAVANAKEAVKAAANYITVSNDNDAIAEIIEDLANGKIIL